MIREYYYQVDRDGRVFHEGTEIVDPATLRFFLLAMRRQPDGRYLVVCQGEHNWFAGPDTPFVVQRVHITLDGGALAAVDLELAGGYRERLDPATLASAADQLVCRVRQGAFVARFGRVAMQQLAPFIDDSGGGPCLRLGGRAHRITEARPT
jgi:Protein of unknown function (DUF1285)